MQVNLYAQRPLSTSKGFYLDLHLQYLAIVAWHDHCGLLQRLSVNLLKDRSDTMIQDLRTDLATSGP